MGRIVTPTHRVEYRDNLLALGKTIGDGSAVINGKRQRVAIMTWNREDGPPTQDNLAKWRDTYNASFQPGGANAHLGEAFGAIPHIHYARVVHQGTDRVVAEITAPAFEVV